MTEQYPKALGNTVQELKEVLQPNVPVVEKTLFSMLTPEVSQMLKQRPTISQVDQQSAITRTVSVDNTVRQTWQWSGLASYMLVCLVTGGIHGLGSELLATSMCCQ